MNETLSIIIGILTLSGMVVSLVSTFVIQREQLKTLRLEHSELAKDFYAHKEKESIHFNEKVSKQVEEKYNQRFEMVEKKLEKMDGKLDQLIQKT